MRSPSCRRSSLVARRSSLVARRSSLVARRSKSIVLPVLVVNLSIAFAYAAPAAHAQQVIAIYRFQEGTAGGAATGTNTIIDSSGNGLNGTPFNSPTYTSVSLPGSTLGLQFTGQGGTQRVFVPDSPLLQLNSLTLEAYIRFDGTPVNNIIASQIVFRGDDRNANDSYNLNIRTDGHLAFEFDDAANVRTSLVSPNVIPLGQFLQVAGTLDDATGQIGLYINGVSVASSVTNRRPVQGLLANQAPGLGIGNVQSTAYNESFNGIIDEVRISNFARTPSQLLPAVSAPDASPFALVAFGGLLSGVGAVRRKMRGQ